MHVFDFDGNLYGRQVCVSFVCRLRPEMKFDSREELIVQLNDDARRAEEILNQSIEK